MNHTASYRSPRVYVCIQHILIRMYGHTWFGDSWRVDDVSNVFRHIDIVHLWPMANVTLNPYIHVQRRQQVKHCHQCVQQNTLDLSLAVQTAVSLPIFLPSSEGTVIGCRTPSSSTAGIQG